MKRFLLDNDGSNIFHNLGEDVTATVAETVRECPSTVSTYLLCSGAGSCYWPSKVGNVDRRARGLLAAHSRGLDPVGMLLRELKAAGKETFITYRMNDVHNPTDTDQWNTPRIRLENPECIVGLDEVRQGQANWMSYCLDYTRDDVREYVLSLVGEQVSLYGDIIDGFQLDWMRFPRHLSGSPEEVWGKRGIITEFTAQVRKVLGGTGREILLGTRVPTTPSGCRSLGFDLAQWAKHSLIDFLVVCPFLTTDWRIPIAEFRDLLGVKRIPVYAGFDFGFGYQKHFPESLRGICASLYDCGADGIYVFNFPCWTEYLAARPYHWLRGLEDLETAAAKPLLFAVDHGCHRIAGVDQKAQIPATIPVGGRLEVAIWVPAAALPIWRGLCLVHSHGDVSIEINGHPTRGIHLGQKPTGAFRSEIFLEFVDQYWDKDTRPKPEDCRAFRVDPAHLRVGSNQFGIANLAAGDLEIERVNLALW